MACGARLLILFAPSAIGWCRYEGYEFIDAQAPVPNRTQLDGVWVSDDKEVPLFPLKTLRLSTFSTDRDLWIVHGTHGPVRSYAGAACYSRTVVAGW